MLKRGYHIHFGTKGNSFLNRPVIDVDGGFLLAPMTRGVRLTTGIEFAPRESVPSPVQLDLTEPRARQVFPLEKRIEQTPLDGIAAMPARHAAGDWPGIAA